MLRVLTEALLMSTHKKINMFSWRNKKKKDQYFWIEKSILSRAMNVFQTTYMESFQFENKSILYGLELC